ncbi:MAG TPA: MMPL family transporter [Gaiellaceae bacterium]|nr:MMPL family transporter [Gaiellaceae bacterium]
MVRAASWVTVRLGFLLVPAWIAAAVAAVHFLPGISKGSSGPLGGLVPGGASAIETQDREVAAFGTTLLTRIVVVQHAKGRLTGAQLRRTAATAVGVDRRRTPRFRRVAFAAPLVSPNRTTTVTYLYFKPDVSADDQLALAQAYARGLDPPGLRTGALPARTSEFDRIQHGLPRVTIATVALIMLILLLTFRAPGPALVALGAAAVAYTISIRVISWLVQHEHRSLPKEIEPILIALLLGLLTDYAVFFVSGMRRRLASGESRFRAAEATTRENLPIILTAGLIVALGSLTLVVGRLSVFRSFGPGMALTVAITMAVALTFLPGLLALLGPILFWPSALDPEPDRSGRRRLWRLATARPASATVAALVAAGLVAAATGLLHAHLGFTIIRGQPSNAEVKVAAENASVGFAPGIVAPTEVLLEGDVGRRRPALARFERGLRAVPGVADVIGPREQPKRRDLPVFVARNGRAARYAVVLDQEPLGAKAIDVLDRIQTRVPALLHRTGLGGVRVSYAGDTALAQETVSTVRSDGYRVGAVVLLVNFVLLAVFLRAIWVPLLLLGASVLALAASLGALTWVMQGLLGHEDLTYYVPFAAAVLLLSLGSDYNVFVVGGIRRVARDKPLREAIAESMPRASSTITTAGLALAGSFATLALIPLRPMRELALVLALGILVDTFIVRSLLVPTLLALFRRERPPQTAEDSTPTADDSAQTGTVRSHAWSSRRS